MAWTTPHCVRSVEQPLPAPPGLRLRAPVLVIAERWSDGAVIARWPAAGLFAYGGDEAAACVLLAEVVVDYWHRTAARLARGVVTGSELEKWKVVSGVLAVAG